MKSSTKSKVANTIGILAFQGGVIEHAGIIEKLGHKALQVKTINDLEACDALIIPGGESTTIGFFLEESGLLAAVKKRAQQDMPIWGTCAGAILLAKKLSATKFRPISLSWILKLKETGMADSWKAFMQKSIFPLKK